MQMGRVAALLEIAEQQAESDAAAYQDTMQLIAVMTRPTKITMTKNMTDEEREAYMTVLKNSPGILCIEEGEIC